MKSCHISAELKPESEPSEVINIFLSSFGGQYLLPFWIECLLNIVSLENISQVF